MKKILISFNFAVVMLLIITACGTNAAEELIAMAQAPSIGQMGHAANISDESTSSSICHDKALSLFEALDSIIDADGGYLWGMDLRGPIMFADAQSRYAIANMPDANGEIFTRQSDLYIGKIPEDISIFSRNLTLGDTHWAMISWADVRDDNHDWTMALMLHKLFHTRQPYVFQGSLNWGVTDHMEELDASISGRLEINALLNALRSTDNERLISIHNALSIRYERHKNNSEFATAGEIAQEILEGSVTYTEVMLLFDDMEDRLQFIEYGMSTTGRISLFGYWSGALYGLLLDELGVDWRTGLAWYADLAEILQNSIDFGGAIPLAEIDLECYNYSAVRLVEEARIAEI